MRRSRLCMRGITWRTGWSARISTRALTTLARATCHGENLLIRRRLSAGPTCLRMCVRRARGPMKSGVRRGLRGPWGPRGLRGVAMAAAALLPAPLPRRLRRRVRPPGSRRRGASHRASGVGRVTGIPALVTGTPALRGSRQRRRRREGAGSAGGPRHLRAARATRTTLAGPRAFRPRIRRLLESSQARGRRSRRTNGVASRHPRLTPLSAWLVPGRTELADNAGACRSWNAGICAGCISSSNTKMVGMGVWTGPSRRES